MRTYEALYIIQPEAGEDEVQTIARGVETLITEDGGAIVNSEIWGKRRLAYDVKRFHEGVFVLLRFDGEPPIVKKLTGHFTLNESIIRHLIVLFDEKTLRLEVEQARRNEQALQSRGPVRRRDVDDSERSRPETSEKDAKEPVEA